MKKLLLFLVLLFPMTVLAASGPKLNNVTIDKIKFEFKPDTLVYNISYYNANTSIINITATADDSAATITGAGVKELFEGENVLLIDVENGSQKNTYKFVVNYSKTPFENFNPDTADVDITIYVLLCALALSLLVFLRSKRKLIELKN